LYQYDIWYMVFCVRHRRTQKTSLRPEQDWKQHRTGHHTVNRVCVCSEGKAPDDGHNSARNMLKSFKVFKVIVRLVGLFYLILIFLRMHGTTDLKES
jgi:hypothetical protein